MVRVIGALLSLSGIMPRIFYVHNGHSGQFCLTARAKRLDFGNKRGLLSRKKDASE